MNKPSLETNPATSKRLGQVRQSSTKPELVVRSLVYKLGHRYRVRNRDLPGSPDLANRARAWAIFVHGCFWPSHEGCPKATVPKRNREFWLAKFKRNRERDLEVTAELLALGFKVLTVWECETREPPALKRRLNRALRAHLPVP